MSTELVDWELAVRVGSRTAPKGPVLPLDHARDYVAELRDYARSAHQPVSECTGLVTPPHALDPVVVDRNAWIASNVESFRYILAPLLEKNTGDEGLGTQIGARVTGAELGAVLGWVSGKVLGQYEALVAPTSSPRLLLVAPNILKVADELDLDLRDFSLWVCLHEETHRVQFTAVPWLSDYFAAEVKTIVAGTSPSAGEVLSRSRQLLGAVLRVVRGQDGISGVLKVMQSPEQRKAFDRITALMTLLEGHADVVMDEVGPGVVPSVATIRQRFNQRRSSPSMKDALIRRAIGMDEKLQQYSRGAGFVRAVIDDVGMAGFNQVFAQPAYLPTLAEIDEPATWIARVSQ